jgi:hypothetical protein
VKQIRPNIYEVTYTELGQPDEYGVYSVDGLGNVHMDLADLRYIGDQIAHGYEPIFFVSRAPAMNNEFVVVSRNRRA